VRWSSRSTAVDRLGVKKMKNKVGWKAGRTVRREVKAGLRCRSAASSTLSKSAEARTDIRFLRGRHDDRELKESMNPSLDIIYRETGEAEGQTRSNLGGTLFWAVSSSASPWSPPHSPHSPLTASTTHQGSGA